MRKGFTILELLVASLLLAMLVTMLSMIFNQSSIAWRTGVAGVVELDDIREKIGTIHDIEDEILPGLGDTNPNVGQSDSRSIRYRTVSLFKGDSLRSQGSRSFEQINWDAISALSMSQVLSSRYISLGGGQASRGVSAFAVGVRSAGPDREFETADDITTWPEEVD